MTSLTQHVPAGRAVGATPSRAQRFGIRKSTPAHALAAALIAAACSAPQSAFAYSCPSAITKMAQILGTSYTPDIMVLAHRGLWGKYAGNNANMPENSRGALLLADQACMDGVELDVKMTKDGVPVLMHDFNVGRTTNAWLRLGGQKYNPFTNQGQNAAVSSLTSNTLESFFLLTPDRQYVTAYHVPRVDQLLVYWAYNSLNTPMVFDTKTADAVRAVDAAATKAFRDSSGPSAREVVAVKVNATLFPNPRTFFATASSIRAIPVFTTNMLSKINVTATRLAWQNYTSTLEINVKQQRGLLHDDMEASIRAGKRVGVFHAIPDGPIQGQFYQNTGQCCYKLSSLYASFNYAKDTADYRGDQGFLLTQGYGLITTDDPKAVNRFLFDHYKRQSHAH